MAYRRRRVTYRRRAANINEIIRSRGTPNRSASLAERKRITYMVVRFVRKGAWLFLGVKRIVVPREAVSALSGD